MPILTTAITTFILLVLIGIIVGLYFNRGGRGWLGRQVAHATGVGNSSITGPLGNTFEDSTSGGGLGDITTRAQLGLQEGDFAHTAYVQVVAPSGRYQPGFEPIIGLHRPGIDTGSAFTWTEKPSKLQFNGGLDRRLPSRSSPEAVRRRTPREISKVMPSAHGRSGRHPRQ